MRERESEREREGMGQRERVRVWAKERARESIFVKLLGDFESPIAIVLLGDTKLFRCLKLLLKKWDFCP